MTSVYYSSFEPSEDAGAKGSAAFASVTVASLTVPSSIVPTLEDGTGGVYTSSGGFMIVTRSDEVLTAVFSVVSITPSSPTWITINASTGQYTVEDPLVDAASAVLRATVDGSDYDLTYSLAKVRKGIDGINGVDGIDGSAGAPAISGYLTNEAVSVFAFANGVVTSYAPATGLFVILSGNTDISTNFTLSTLSNPQALTVAYSNRTYTISGGLDANEDTASLTIRATGSGAFVGVVVDKVFSLAKTRGGYEIVSTLPASGDPRSFEGSVVFLTTDYKLYRYNGTAWTSTVPTGDLTGTISNTQIADNSISTPKLQTNAITADKIEAGAITAAKLATTELITLSAQIKDAIITSAKIGDAQITSAKIGDLEVNSAKIANLTVGTEKITGNAVTVPVSAYTQAGIVIASSQTIQSLSITTSGAPVQVFFSFLLTTTSCIFRLTRNGTDVIPSSTLSGGGLVAFAIGDAPAAGTQTYALLAQGTGTGPLALLRSLLVIETKR